MEELSKRMFEFLPEQSVLWSALGTLLFSVTVQYTIKWLKNKAILPWMREDNLKRREEIIRQLNKPK
ncbi:hypothetical protein CathTA2_1408 [Caldalkalibacillus thermarum TA2.A1]|uniref:Uncharacterized protein n=1 Tax=Caldalkalibacillus thermarum (strain TA2.A1) TaxID=986075 RepID=F5L6F8_CALTT|nr:hypothetical protein [Caldalkalibacillus thermarum]EGL83068.1 hypothetical protein CathTA2_1408 [Caldalkalibacillus thermarum TA2.A1]